MVNNPRQFLFGKGSEQMMVNIGPMTWAGTMPLLIELISNGTPEGHLYARGELMRLARAVDQNNEEIRTPDEEVHDAR